MLGFSKPVAVTQIGRVGVLLPLRKKFSFLLDKYPWENHWIIRSRYMLNFLRNCQTPQYSCTLSPSYQQGRGVWVVPHPCQHSVYSVFSILTIRTDTKWLLIVVLFSICLLICNIEHLFMCYLVPVFLLWWTVCSNLSPILKIGCWSSYFLTSDSFLYIFWIQVLYHIYTMQIMFPTCLLILLSMPLKEQTFLILITLSSPFCSFMDLALDLLSKKISAWPKVTKIYSYVWF